MSAFKTLKKSDVYVTPYIANKQWSFTGSFNDLTGSSIYVYYGNTLVSSENFNPNISGSLGRTYYNQFPLNNVNPYLIGYQIRQLYYSNFISSSHTPTSSYGTSSRNYQIEELGYFDNFNQSTLKTWKFAPSSSFSTFTVVSIPQEIYGSKIVPTTFKFSGSFSTGGTVSFNIRDDGEGNLINISTNRFIGNIIYSHGIIILSSATLNLIPQLGIYSSSLSCKELSFKGEHIIYENEIRCHVREDEFNFSQNPSTLDVSGSMLSNVTGSDFSPYVTTVGLYNEYNELLAVGKFAKPIPMSPNTDMTFVVRYDM